MSNINLIFGGAGFIGSNLAKSLLQSGERVLIFDDLSLGSKKNVSFLQIKIKDTQCGFKLYKKQIAKKIFFEM